MCLEILIARFLTVQVNLRRENGQTLAEYGILIAVIAVVTILAAVLLGSSISTLFFSSARKV
jgi:Flp pilus assembly pilin Flp